MTVCGGDSDCDYIIRVIQYLDQRHGIRFFINSRDFDVLYRWWEKRVPEAVIRECIDRVVQRRRRLRRPLDRFSAFSNEVRRSYQAYLSLDVGRQRPEPADEHEGIRDFLAHFPRDLEPLKGEFADLCGRLLRGEAADAEPLREKLLAHFRDDGEMRAKAAWFMKNLAPSLRRPEIERRYCLNYLWGKFGIPPLE